MGLCSCSLLAFLPECTLVQPLQPRRPLPATLWSHARQKLYNLQQARTQQCPHICISQICTSQICISQICISLQIYTLKGFTNTLRCLLTSSAASTRAAGQSPRALLIRREALKACRSLRQATTSAMAAAAPVPAVRCHCPSLQPKRLEQRPGGPCR